MDQKTQQAVEGLRKIMVVFHQAGAIADTLESFASAEAAAAGHLARLKTVQEEYRLAVDKFQKITERHDDEVKLIAKDALALQATLATDIAEKKQQLADLAQQTASAQQQLADIEKKIAQAEATRQKFLAALN